MWSKIASGLICVLLISGLVGCGDSSSSGGGGGGRTLTSITITPSSASIPFGTTEQYSATGNYSDGTSQQLTGLAWSSSDTDVATISTDGLAEPLKHGGTTITATKGSISGSTGLTVTTELLSIGLTPIGPGILVDGSQQFTAIGNFDDATTADLTPVATWNSSDQTKATITGGMATGVAVGVTTITATASAVSGASIVGSTALDVVDTPYPALNGSYAFSLTSGDTRGPQLFAGSFIVDGAGKITGSEDSNTGAGVVQSSLTGSYVSYPDGRGTITIDANDIYPLGITFRYILSNAGGSGKLIQFDTLGAAAGSFEQQNIVALDAGNYVFRTSGIDSGTQAFDNGIPQPMGQVGVFAADGAGNITTGAVDSNDYGQITASVPLTASTYSSEVDENGRGTLQLTTASGTSNFAYYVVNSTRAALIQMDAAPANAVAGVAEFQTNQTYDNSSLSGGYSYLVTRPVIVGTDGAADRREFAQEGAWAFNSGTATLTGTRDDANNTDANGNNLNPLTDITGTYAVTADGRGTMNAASAMQGTNRKYTFYFVSPQKLFLLQTTNFNKATFNAPTGVAEQQVGFPYNKATLDGVYALGAADIVATYTGALVRLTFDGLGGTGGIGDVSANHTISSSLVKAAYSGFNPNPDASIGRGGIVLDEPIGARNYILYFSSPTETFVLGTATLSVGTMSQQ